jgi:hypothetical protein
LSRRIYEVDPLLCLRCHVAIKIVAVLPQLDVVHCILRHVARTGGDDPFEQTGPRAPPAA